MDDARGVNRTEVNSTQEKIDFINDANQKELQYCKNIALVGKNENERKELTDLAPLRVFLARKDFVKNYATNVKVNELIFHLKNNYLPHNEEPVPFIEDITNEEDRRSFEEISNYLKTFTKSIKEGESISLKNKVLMGGWLSTVARVFRRDKNMRGENLPGRFEDWMYRECRIKKQTIYNYKNLYKLMRLAPKFLLKTTRFFLVILKRTKNRYHGNITFIASVKLVAHTLLCGVKSVVNNDRYLL